MGGFGATIGRFMRELRRRRVFRVAALYIVGAWLALQIADVLFPGFGIPDAAIQALVWAAVLGFPVALVFGWLFDIGPTGIHRTAPAEVKESADYIALQRIDYLILTAFIVVALLIAYTATQEVIETPREQPVEPRITSLVEAPVKLPNSIAVLPFTNVSKDPDNEYFCDGVSEEILNKLSGFRELNVIGRTSSFVFKGSDYAAPRMAVLLGVRFLLQGSVRKIGDQLRVSAQLLDEGGLQIWSQNFDRELKNVFAIQSEIAEVVATTVAPQVAPQPVSKELPDLEAYEHYLRGRELLHKRNNEAAREELQKAIEIDPNSAEAQAELAIALLMGSPRSAVVERAQQAIDTALSLRPKLLRAQLAQGFLLMQKTPPDHAGAEKVMREVLAQEPNMSDALLWLSSTLSYQGRDDESFPILEHALRIDPFHPSIAGNLVSDLKRRGESERASDILQRMLDQPRPHFSIYMLIRESHRINGRLVEMTAVAKRLALDLGGPQHFSLALSYGLLGNYSSATYWLERSVREFPNWRFNDFYPSISSQFQGDYITALDRIRFALESNGLLPTELGSNDRLWFASLQAAVGHYNEAITNLEPLVSVETPFGSTAAYNVWANDGVHALAWSYSHTGEESKATVLLEHVEKQCQQKEAEGLLDSGALHYCAENALLSGDVELAMERLERAVDTGWRDYYVRHHDPRWAAVQDHPRYMALMARAKADIDRQRAEVERIDATDDFIARLDAVMEAKKQSTSSDG